MSTFQLAIPRNSSLIKIAKLGYNEAPAIRSPCKWNYLEANSRAGFVDTSKGQRIALNIEGIAIERIYNPEEKNEQCNIDNGPEELIVT